MPITEIPPSVEQRQVDDLFLLVGGNPLPNAVAGRTLLKEGGRIVLVYSDQTDDVRRNLTAWLEDTLKYRNKGATVEPVNVKPADASSIYGKLKAAIGDDVRSRTVGLHYTGGKKSMAVHAYRAIADAAETPVMSYLEASTLTFHFDPPDPERPGGGERVYVGDAVNLQVEDLLKLHGWTLSRGAPAHRPLMLKTAQALLDVYTEGRDNALGPWKSWKGKWRWKWQKNTDRGGNATKQLKRWEAPVPANSHLGAVASALREDLGSAITENGRFDEGFRFDKAAEAGGFDGVDDFCRWMDGSWLESIVLGRTDK